jgi:hypothetical protein
MTDRPDRLEKLARIAELVADKARQPVLAAQARVDAQHARIDALAAHRAALAFDGLDPADAARLARQAQRLRGQQAAGMSDLANARAALEHARAEARPALARRLVLQRLLKTKPKTI